LCRIDKEWTMLQTPLCRLLGIDAPVICAPFGPWEQVDLAAAVCQAGGLGSLGTAVRPLPDLAAQWARLRERTDRPFAINHTARPFDGEAFAATLRFRPAAISFHLGVPAELIARAHDAGILWIQQVMDRQQAERALDAGADVIVAQGGEAGGHSGWVSTMVLVPQVVDLAGNVPVVAAGASPTAAASPPRWRSAPRASAWARASLPAARCGSPRNGSGASSPPTRWRR
jgi:enoyl-[acyl-carrier protein] reductase II